ncbi:hypothetical protein BDP27DRAFT_1546373 [Rhodocollybia butyracea]|uniref:Uncharacterized protein n=1 Tax=Rhodocollybia butyracea TaxID=206335 RepID=A0A9P5PQC3_9AGAR|nr:hypothetical protein BDP27DRAFT_1546373 [Rhodocollybia butyracea]
MTVTGIIETMIGIIETMIGVIETVIGIIETVIGIIETEMEIIKTVIRALRIQAGDISQIQRYQQSVQHQHLFDPLEYNTINTGVQNMATALEEASAKSEDITEHTPLAPVEVIHTGQRGRPRKNIDRELLETSLRLRGPTHIAPVFDCSSRTIRRRALEHGLVEVIRPNI